MMGNYDKGNCYIMQDDISQMTPLLAHQQIIDYRSPACWEQRQYSNV